MAPPRLYPLPNEQLSELLHVARAQGKSFEQAWQEAVRPGLPLVMSNSKHPPAGAIRWPTDRTDRQAWQAAIGESKDGWRRAYQRRPCTVPERAIARLGDELRALDGLSTALAGVEGIRRLEPVRSAA